MDSKMITRSAKRRSMHLECNSVLLQVPDNEIQIQSRSCISIETSGYIPPGNEQFQNSIYNIHIHPPTHEIVPIKLSMCGIQPLIHIYPNNTLQLITGNESRQLTPDLGDLDLSFENNSAGRNYLELGNNTSSERCLTGKKVIVCLILTSSLLEVIMGHNEWVGVHFDETSDNVGESANEFKNSSPQSSKGSFSSEIRSSNESFKKSNSTPLKNNKEISSYTYDTDSIKLNKAVVVLTDICKTKYYKAALADYAAKDEAKANGTETKADVSSLVLKQECLKSSSGMTDNWYTNTTDGTFDSGPSLESVHSTPLSGSRLLTQLAEGCSFSEILNRFRIKNGNCLVNTVKCADTVNHENFNTEHLEDHENTVLKSETCSFYDENTVEVTSGVTEKIEAVNFEDHNLIGFSQGSEYEELREDFEHLRNQSLDSQMGSDHNGNTTATQTVSGDVSADEETVDSSYLTANMVQVRCNAITSEAICSTSETSNNYLSSMNNSDLNLNESEQPNFEVDKERMRSKKLLGINKSKNKKNKKSKSTSTKTGHSPSPKKMKQSNKKSETFQNKGKLPDEYIPLQAAGPTKFGVAMINQIKPYVQHDAKDFKNKMLFGDRNKRVSSSQHMRMYKLKQEVNRSVRR